MDSDSDDGGAAAGGGGAGAGAGAGAGVGAGAGGTGATPAKKRARFTGDNYTRSSETVLAWGPSSAILWGFRGASDTDQDKQSARLYLSKEAKVICATCGSEMKACKSNVASHASKPPVSCVEALKAFNNATTKNLEHNEARAAALSKGAEWKLGGERPPPPYFLNWAPKHFMLCSVVSRDTRTDFVAPDAMISKQLVSSIFASHDISFAAQAKLFGAGSPVLAALRLLKPGDGLGSDKLVAKNVGLGVNLVFDKKIKPMLRDAIDKGLFIAVAPDESPVPDGAALLVHFYAANMVDTAVVDVKVLGKAANSAMLLSEIKWMMTREGFLSEAEWDKHVKILAGDHASYVIKAARDGGLDFSGDPAHAFDLVIKVALSASKLKPLFMLLRSILNSHSYVMVRACEAFVIHKSVAKVSTTRWGYWGTLMRFLSDASFVSRLQQMFSWLFVNLYGGKVEDVAAGVASAPWVLGVNFAPDDAEDDNDDDAEHAAEQNLGDHAKVGWGVKGGGHELGGADSESESDDDAPTATVNSRKQKQILCALRALCDPRILAQIAAVCLIVEPLRSAQVKMQTSDALSPDTISAMEAAYESLETSVKSAAAFNATVEPAFSAINASVGVSPDVFESVAAVNKMEDGTLVVTNSDTLTKPTLIVSCADLEAVEKMKKAVLEATRPSILGAIDQYMKFCAVAYKIAFRRSVAAGNCSFKAVSFLQLLKEKGPPGFAAPLPPDLRGGGVLQAAAVAGDAAAGLAPLGGAVDASANTVHAEWQRFLLVCENPVSDYFFKPEYLRDGKMCDYWLLVRKGYPNVAKVMLWWLSFPVGTAGIERDFSGLTMVTRAFRRRRLKRNNFRFAVLTHCFKADLEQLLVAHVRTASMMART
jgi:hypothetical protein